MTRRSLVPPPAAVVAVAAAWHGVALDAVDDETLAAARAIALRNHVAGRLARAYPERLGEDLRRVTAGNAAMRANLASAAATLDAAGIAPVLVKLDLALDSEYSNFDLVLGDRCDDAVRALGGWAVRQSRHRLEPDKLLLHPAEGPAAHLHRHLSWFGVDAIAAGTLHIESLPAPEVGPGLRLPTAAAELRCWLAHACFQNLSVELAELLSLRRLLDAATVAAAQRAAAAEGWERSFERAAVAVAAAVARLDAGGMVPLPVPLPLGIAGLAGVEHAAALARQGRPAMAARELALRGPLLAAKRRRWRIDRHGTGETMLVGVSGPDGVGKSSVVGAMVEDVTRAGGTALSLHPYGCVFCRSLGRYAPGEAAGTGAPVTPSSPLGRAAHAVHGGVDAAEMDLRLRLAVFRARRRGRRRAARGESPLTVVVTDRSPLDSLVKYTPPAAAAARAWFSRMARRYDRLVCLDAPAATLAARDPDHQAEHLEARRGDFAELVGRVSGAVLLPLDDRGPEQIGAALVDSLQPVTPEERRTAP